MKDESPEQLVLDYRGAVPRERRRFRDRLLGLNKGDDTFLGCSALLFALLTWVMAVLGRLLGDGGMTMCLSFPVGCLSAFLGLCGLLERRSSWTFSLVSLGLDAAFFAWAFLGVGH